MVSKLHMEMKPIPVLKVWKRHSGEGSRQTETTSLWKKKKKGIYLAVGSNPTLRQYLFHQQIDEIVINNVAFKVRKKKRLRNRWY